MGLKVHCVGAAGAGRVESGGGMVSCGAEVAGKAPALPQECGFHTDNRLRQQFEGLCLSMPRRMEPGRCSQAGPSWQGSSLLSAFRERGTSPLLGTSDEKPCRARVKCVNAELRFWIAVQAWSRSLAVLRCHLTICIKWDSY